MQNETKLSPEVINSLLRMMKKGGDNPDSLKKIVNESLGEGQKQAISKILSDPQKLREMLSSPQAKALLEKFGKAPQGENSNGSA